MKSTVKKMIFGALMLASAIANASNAQLVDQIKSGQVAIPVQDNNMDMVGRPLEVDGAELELDGSLTLVNARLLFPKKGLSRLTGRYERAYFMYFKSADTADATQKLCKFIDKSYNRAILVGDEVTNISGRTDFFMSVEHNNLGTQLMPIISIEPTNIQSGRIVCVRK